MVTSSLLKDVRSWLGNDFRSTRGINDPTHRHRSPRCLPSLGAAMFGMVLMASGCASPLTAPIVSLEEEIVIRGQSPDQVDPAFGQFANGSSPSAVRTASNENSWFDQRPSTGETPQELPQTRMESSRLTNSPTLQNSVSRLSQFDREESAAPKPNEVLADVRIEGNTTIPVAAMSGYIKTRPGRPTTVDQVRDDVRALYNTKWFFSIEPVYRRADEGLILIYKVTERPILRSVAYVGNDKVKEGELEGITGLKPMHAFSVATNREAARRIQEHYKGKGYLFAEVNLEKGANQTDREVIFNINEGPRVKVSTIRFEGNKEVSAELLKLRLTTKKRFMWTFGGQYDPSTIKEDVVIIKKYYHAIGYFDATVEDSIEFSDDQSLVTVRFKIDEGPRYKIRNILVEGNQIYSREQLLKDFKTKEGEYFTARDLSVDVEEVQGMYGRLGRLFAKVGTESVFTQEPGVVDLKLTIDEDRVYRIGRVNVNIRGTHTHTRETVAYNQLLVAPGDLADPEKIRRSRARFAGASTWESAGPDGPDINIRPVSNPSFLANRPEADPPVVRGSDGYFGSDEQLQPGGTLFTPTSFQREEVHPSGQDAGGVSQDVQTPGRAHIVSPIPGAGHSLQPLPDPAAQTSYYRTERKKRPSDEILLTYQPIEFETAKVFVDNGTPFISEVPEEHLTDIEKPVFRAQNYDNYNDPPNLIYSQTPQGDLLGPQQRVPQLPPGYVDLDVNLTEARTGRFMVGAGVNSDSGVVGNIVLEEQNFDISRFPTSFRDVVDGYAFRGGGQQFRLEATPGSEVSRYLVSWTDPYFYNTDYSLGVSGFFYERFFRDWQEERLGGRVNVGRLLTRELSFNSALRLENVSISNPRLPNGAAPSVDEIVGDNFLGTGRFTLAYDTRDSATMATEGFNLSSSVEQAFADYDFTKLDLQASQYFTVYQRPDGGGKHVLSVRGNVGWTTDDTPAFERYYAGGFQTFRGFEFRSVTPLEPGNVGTNGAAVGGFFQSLGTVEYMFPIMASEAVRLVAFSDFGTVEESVSFEDFRVSVGGGLRVTVPQMGPVPIALDWAFPIVKQETDIRQIFSFYIGLTR